MLAISYPLSAGPGPGPAPPPVLDPLCGAPLWAAPPAPRTGGPADRELGIASREYINTNRIY